jgi:hypothetical protein
MPRNRLEQNQESERPSRRHLINSAEMKTALIHKFAEIFSETLL